MILTIHDRMVLMAIRPETHSILGNLMWDQIIEKIDFDKGEVERNGIIVKPAVDGRVTYFAKTATEEKEVPFGSPLSEFLRSEITQLDHDKAVRAECAPTLSRVRANA